MCNQVVYNGIQGKQERCAYRLLYNVEERKQVGRQERLPTKAPDAKVRIGVLPI